MSRCQSSLLDGFTDDWDAALLSEGTLRPKRAASAMNLREVMKTLNKAPVGAVTKQELENQFSRSMKLLGLDNVDSASSKTTTKPKINNVAPRTITRLEKPTVSYEDIRNAVTDGVDRKVLSQAAYERWYFRKLEEERDSRKLRGFFDLGKHRSKLFEHGMTFSEWLEKKEKERKTKKANPEKNNQEKGTTFKRRLPMSSPATKEAAEKAYKEWMNKKKEEEAKRKQKATEELEAKNASKTREDAEKAFEEWKRTHDEKLTKMEQRKRNKERKLREKEQEEKARQLQDNEKAFNAWLSSKNQTLEKKAEKSKKQSTKKSMEEQRKLVEKRYEANQAFEEWLEKKLELEAARAPTPEVKVTKSIQTEDVVKPPTPVPKCRPSATFPRNLMVPWADFSAKNLLMTSPKHQKREKTDARTPTPKKQKVKFADSFESDSSLEVTPKPSAAFRDFTKIRELSDNKSLMMMYHRRGPRALYYARDLI